jgi:mono/diheme cytochrome c family protein
MRIALFLLATTIAASAADPAASFSAKIQPLLKEHCTGCHGGKNPKAKLDLSGPRSLEQLGAQSHQWFSVLEKIESGAMPPEDEEPLTPATREALAAWVRGDFSDHLLAKQRTEGRSQFRRLSRNEYANTVQDIFGVRPPVMRLMPPDGRVDGYDKVSAALPFSAAATEAQLKMAEDIVSRMFEIPVSKETHLLVSAPSEQSKGHILELPDGWHVSFNTDTTSGPLRKITKEGRKLGPSATKPGRHRLRINAYGYQTDRPLPVGIYVGHTSAYPQILRLLKIVEILPAKPSIVETEVYLRSTKDSDVGVTDGIRLIPLGLGVPVPKNSLASDLGKGKPGLALHSVEIEELDESLPGQRLLTEGMSEPLRLAFQRNLTLKSGKIPREELESFAKTSLTRVGTRLFRRDLTEAEVTRSVTNYLTALDAGSTLKAAYIEEVAALMTAPDFLGVIEQPGRLDDFALASRLSYFLWNSAPDDELLALARTGKLGDDASLRTQTERLLKDPKSERFVADFLDQWLGLWGIDNTTPDKDLYPEYDDMLKFSSVMETQATFRRMLDKNLGVREFVAPKWALLNERLAAHYGIAGPKGFELREVSLPADTPFGGFWTQAATMKVTANGTLTSPIKRGVWVSERLMGIKIPLPPPVEGIAPDIRGAKTLREQLELHRKGSCSACHAKFDPYGFALENFDVMGQYRTAYRTPDPELEKLSPAAREGKALWKDGLPVDNTGVTPDGKAFAGIRELRELVAQNPEALARGFTRHLVTYATGEPATPIDQPAIDAIVADSAKDGPHGVRSLIHSLVRSELFRSK